VKVAFKAVLLSKTEFSDISKSRFSRIYYISQDYLRDEFVELGIVKLFYKDDSTIVRIYNHDKEYSVVNPYEDTFDRIDPFYTSIEYKDTGMVENVHGFKTEIYTSLMISDCSDPTFQKSELLYLSKDIDYYDTYYQFVKADVISMNMDGELEEAILDNIGFEIRAEYYWAQLIPFKCTVITFRDMVEYKKVRLTKSLFTIPAGYKKVPYDPNR